MKETNTIARVTYAPWCPRKMIRRGAVLVVSEKLTEESNDWKTIPPNSMLTVNHNLDTEIREIELTL